jgi:hypothetical protein
MAWTSPRTWVAGEVITAALLNAHVRDNLLELNGTASAWTSWTPTLTNLTLGNGTMTCRYKQHAKTVEWRIFVLTGTTTVVGTNPQFSVPVAEVASSVQSGSAHMYDSSTASLWYGSSRVNSAVIQFISSGGRVAATDPFVWADGDQLVGGGTYEAA